MTRINVVHPAELTDRFLLAEYRELPRIWRHARPLKPSERVPTYRLGPGHMRFFYGLTGFLSLRQAALVAECLERGFQVQHRTPLVPIPGLDGDWTPTAEARELNLARLRERLLLHPPGWYRYGGEPVGHDFYG